MLKRIAVVVILSVLLVGVLFFAVEIPLMQAKFGDMRIRAEGSGESTTAPISSEITLYPPFIGQNCTFSVYWSGSNLDWCGFTWNGTGSWSNNETVFNDAGVNAKWANISKTLPITNGTVISWRMYCNDSNGIGDTGIINTTITYPDYSDLVNLKCNATTWNSSYTYEWSLAKSGATFKASTGQWVEQTMMTTLWGRFVNITAIDTDHSVNYAWGFEVQVYDYNSSTYKTPTAIYSSCGYSSDYYPSKFIDGSTSTYWYHASAHYHEIVLDMGSSIQISKIQIYAGVVDGTNWTCNIYVGNYWQTVGNSPWVNASDDNSYVFTNINNAMIGNFTFENIWYRNFIRTAYVQTRYYKLLSGTSFTLQYFNGSQWLTTSVINSSTGWITQNVSLQVVDAYVNNITIKIYANISGSDILKIDYLTLYVRSWTLINRIRFYLDSPDLVNWTTWDGLYFGLLFNKTSISDIEDYIDSLAEQQDWENVMHCSIPALKYGIIREDTIKYALGNITQVGGVGGSLPDTDDSANGFHIYDRDVLYGCGYFSEYFDYLTDKWNATEMYNDFKTAIETYCTSPTVYWIGEYSVSEGYERFYDEYAETIQAYLTFYELGVNEALDDAVNVWSWLNNRLWNVTDQYYWYRPDWSGYECSAGSFLKIIALLRWFDPSIENSSRLGIDYYSRFFKDGWNSPQWKIYTDEFSTYQVLHHNPSNTQRRLHETMCTWFSIYGAYSALNTTSQQNLKEMLNEAWYLLYHPYGLSYDSNTEMFRQSSDAAPSQAGTINALTLHLLLGIIPINTTVAFPLEEYYYYYDKDVDAELFGINPSAYTLNVSVYRDGALRFIYGGSPVDYNFPNAGMYQVTFNSSWTGIQDVTRLGDLPSGRKYLVSVSQIGVDGTPLINSEVVFRAYWQSWSGMDMALFYWNYTGTMLLNGSTALSGSSAWSNFSRTLPSTACVIAWYIVANDTDGNWENTTVQYLTIYTTLIHDVAVVNVATAKNIVAAGCVLSINVKVSNQGTYTETFNVSVYANTTSINTAKITMTSGTSTTIPFTWNTADFAKGNYTIKAIAATVPDEIETLNNNLTDGWVIVAMAGDLTGSPNGYPDGTCNMKDIRYVAKRFGIDPTNPQWDPNADVIEDNIIDLKDTRAIAKYFGKEDP